MSLRNPEYISQEFDLEHGDTQILKIDRNSQNN